MLVSLTGLRLSGLPIYASFGVTTGIAVVAVMAAALTLTPALAGLAGRRLRPRPRRKPSAEPLNARWAARVGRRPLPWAIGGAVLMILLALPVLDMRTWPQDPSTQTTDVTTRRAYDLVSDELGPGFNGPLTLVAGRDAVSAAETEALASELGSRDDLVAVTPRVESPDGALTVFSVVPAFGPTDPRTPALVDDLREQVGRGSRSPGRRRCSPTSPTCSPAGCGW